MSEQTPHPSNSPLRQQRGENQAITSSDSPSPLVERGRGGEVFPQTLIILRGGGDLGSGVAIRLYRAGFSVLILELPRPIMVRRTVCFGMVALQNRITVEGVEARLIDSLPARDRLPYIPVLIDPDGTSINALKPDAVIDARMAKVNLGTAIHDAPLVIGMGPGFTAGVDCHAVIETNRGHNLGRVYWTGQAEPDTGTPGLVNGRGAERVIRAPKEGFVTRQVEIGSTLREGQAVAYMGDTAIPAAFDGVLRGLVHESVAVRAGQKIGDLDPRGQREHCFTISDKALALGGGALETVLSWLTKTESE